MLTLQSLLSLTLCCKCTHMYSSCLMHPSGVSTELSTTLTLAMPPLATSHHTGCQPLSSRRWVIKLMTCYDKISFNPQSPLGVLQRYLYAARIYMVNHNPQICGRLSCTFAKLDFANRYWQVPAREDRGKTTVVTHCGLFEFISMPFGLKTARATLQRLMQATFSDFLMRNVTGSSDHQHGFCILYVDDLIV